jgi:4-amino-4-deoxy-L-arabinose transferase-like glycosyltransferase
MPWWYLVTLLAANLFLLPPTLLLRVPGALLLIGLLPGLSWARRFWPTLSPLSSWLIAAALSYSFTLLATLLLSYLPGPVLTWHLLTILNLLAIFPVTLPKSKGATLFSPAPPPPRSPALLFILLVALFLRTANLDYSEFQGDEALAMLTAAEALEGHEDALFLRSKGPAEVLLPMALWQLSGTINEPIARLPFTVVSLLAVVTLYLIGQKIGGQRVGWLAAGFFAFNGFMVAFGRIVQYQVLVVWFSALAFLFALEWRETRQIRLLLLAGLFLGSGLLAHYDAVLVAPAIVWILLGIMTGDRRVRSLPLGPETGRLNFLPGLPSWVSGLIGPSLLFITATLLAALPFYLPFALDPQANRTGDYVGGRIGSELRNNLPDFFHFNTFYSSSYYLIISGLLVGAVLAWLLWQYGWSRWLAVISIAGVIAVTLNPTLLVIGPLDLSILPFALLLSSAFFALLFTPASPLLPTLLWLAIPFLGYNFIVALGLTHIYTIVPAWSLLAGLSWHYFFDASQKQSPTPPCSPAPLLSRISTFLSLISTPLLIGLALLSTLFLWNAFIRHDVEYWQNYPAGNLPFYWTPYEQPPSAGFFGFAHRAGWKTVGQKIATGELAGDYGSNEEPDVTTWYTRGAPRACDPQPEFYFLAEDLIDPVDLPNGLDSTYEQIGQVTLPNQKQMRIIQLMPATLSLGNLSDSNLAHEFDQTATPAVFARSARGSVPVQANFSDLIRLIGYDFDTRRAYPGGRVPVTLYWQALASIPISYQVFTHLESETGPVAQADGVPVCWSYPTDTWRPGQIIADQHAIQLAPEVLPGIYPLQVGLYQADTFARLEVLDEAGNLVGNSVTLTEVRITSNNN